MSLTFRSWFQRFLMIFVGIWTFFQIGSIQTAVSQIDFRRDIQPILSNKCYPCHGPDEQTREGGLRFDLKASAFAEADSGEKAIVPGSIEKSEMARRIFADDSEQMPPSDQEKQLNETEKTLIRKWIAGGAKWQNHWAFETPRKPALPKLANDDWVRNEIDRFVLARLESQRHQPKNEADRTTLIRRLTFDLTGLPPTLDEIDAFLADDSADAFEKLVDRLLKSPHYGEHMASAWLDAARFADTNGYQNDFSRNMWPWRDWVIDAYNKNKPFDQFVVEQIAGDLLPNPTRDQIIATGFNRNHRTVTEGGSIEQEWLVENVVDRAETTATVFLGLTMGCARCHDHKYDPISQQEFYEFFAYFYNVNELGFHSERRGNVPPLIKVVTAEHQKKLAEFDEQIKKLENRIGEIKSSLAQQQAKWEKQYLQRKLSEEVRDHVLGILNPTFEPRTKDFARQLDSSTGGRKTNAGPFGPAVDISGQDQSQIAFAKSFDFARTREFSVSGWVFPRKFGAILSRMDAENAYRGFDMLLMPSGELNVHLIHQWPANAIKITTRSRLVKDQWSLVTVTYDGSSKSSGIKVFFNGQSVPFRVNVDALRGTTKTAHPLWLGYRSFTNRFAGQISDLRIYNRKLKPNEVATIFDHSVTRLMRSEQVKPTAAQKNAIDQLFRVHFASDFSAAEKKRDEAIRAKRQFENRIPTTMVMEERATPRKCYVLNRGQYDRPDKSRQVFPGTPRFLPKPRSGSPANRLGLARWLVDPQNPLTARVAVNRVWEQFFGLGLLESSENFGVQSLPPAHQKLMDWLAVELVQSKWNLKRLQKKIVMSATYRQSSQATPEEYRRDPKNRLFARGPRFRLSAEQIRDNALAISGLINRQVGGPSIKPYQPEGVWKDLAGGAGQGPYVQDRDENLYRRSLYIYRKRTVPHPTMTTFDGGAREVCQVSRARTNTPMQALAMLNDTTYVEAARKLAELSLAGSSQTEKRLETMFRQSTARLPGKREGQRLRTRLNHYLQYFESHSAEAAELIKVGQSKPDPKLKAVELAAYTVIASIILNLDETVTRE